MMFTINLNKKTKHKKAALKNNMLEKKKGNRLEEPNEEKELLLSYCRQTKTSKLGVCISFCLCSYFDCF